MDSSAFRTKRYQLSVLTGMNQRYHQRRTHVWTVCNRSVQITVGVLAVAGVCLSVAAWLAHDDRVDIAAIIVASLAAIAAIALNVLPLGDWSQQHADLFRRWSDLREDIDGLLFDVDGDPGIVQSERLKQLDAKVHRICGSEPHFQKKLLEECLAEEEQSRRFASAQSAGA